MPKLLKSLFNNAGIPVNDNFGGRDRWEAGMPTPGLMFVDDGDPGAGGGGDGKGGKGEGDKDGDNKTGKSTPTDAEAALLKEVMDKKSRLNEATKLLEQANARLKDFEGLDAAEIRKLLAEQKDRETKALEAKGEWDKLRKQMADGHEAELGAERQKTAAEVAARQALEKRIDDLAIGNAFGNSKFIVDELSLPVGKTRQLFGSHFEVVDGAVVAYDKPAGAKGRVQLVDSKGEPLSFDAALTKLVDADPDAENLRKSKLKKGTGSGGDKHVTPPEKDLTLSGKDRIKAGLAARKRT